MESYNVVFIGLASVHEINSLSDVQVMKPVQPRSYENYQERLFSFRTIDYDYDT